VTVGLLGGEFILYLYFIFNAVLYAIKIVAGFYKVQYEHIKQAVVAGYA